MTYYILTTTDVNAKGIACLFLDNIFKLYGLPDSIVSNRGTQFVSTFTRSLTDLLGIQHNVSTAFHPRLTVKPNGLMQWSNNICEATATINKITGLNSYLWPNSHTTIPCLPLLKLCLFKPCTSPEKIMRCNAPPTFVTQPSHYMCSLHCQCRSSLRAFPIPSHSEFALQCTTFDLDTLNVHYYL